MRDVEKKAATLLRTESKPTSSDGVYSPFLFP
jgi:hypothetical protein